MSAPKNYSHITVNDIAIGRKYHITLNEIDAITGGTMGIRAVSASIIYDPLQLAMMLENDENSPASGFVYGTDSTGIRGWQSASTWNSTYATVLANSASWEESPDISYISGIVDNHTNDITYISGVVDVNIENINNIESTSGIWNSVHSTVLSNSAAWDAGTAGIQNVSASIIYVDALSSIMLENDQDTPASGLVYGTDILGNRGWQSGIYPGSWSPADSAEIDFLPTNYSITQEILADHLDGIDEALGNFAASLVWDTGDTIEIDYVPEDGGYIPSSNTVSGHLFGINDTMQTLNTWFTTAISGNTVSPQSTTNDYVPQWDGTDTNTLKNGIPLAYFVSATGSVSGQSTAYFNIADDISGTNARWERLNTVTTVISGVTRTIYFQ